MKFRQQLQWNHQYQRDLRTNYREKRRRSCQFKIIVWFNVSVEYQKRNTKWFSRYQTHFKNVPAKFTNLPLQSDRGEANQEYRNHSSPSRIGTTRKRVQRPPRKQLMLDISQRPIPTANRPIRRYETNCFNHVGGYDTSNKSTATTTLDSLQTNFLDPSPLLTNYRITSNMPRPNIKFPFSRPGSAEFTLKHWPCHDLYENFSTSSIIPNFEINDQSSSAAVSFNALKTTTRGLRASLKANLPIALSILNSDLRASYLSDFSTNVSSKCSHCETSQTILSMTSNVLNSDLQAPYHNDFSTDVPSRYSHFEIPQTTLLITSSVLDSDLRAPYLDNFPADVPARPSRVDASLSSFSTALSILNLDLSTSLDNQPATTTAVSPFQMNFPDPWIISDSLSSMTLNVMDPDLRAAYFGNCFMNVPTILSQIKHSPTSFLTALNMLNLDLRISGVGSSLSLPYGSPTGLNCNWES